MIERLATRHTDEAFARGADLLKAMAHPLRLSLLVSLLGGPRCVHELVESTGATQPLVSQHLRVLRGADLLVRERRGREVVYSIADDHIHHIVVDAVDHARTEGAHDGPHLHDA
ncbi:ArsR/SmtB family transcription factor [Nodularia spumigena]|uniref:ArsR/SmtB family transcription factor n=1 Tax=Nodularia spumigena TaxID=70799 RepID=UPI002B20CBBC|nr:metalloregulator ArsR/SmtB family transcription factor [Nodularia spumigena]MEA5558029.1 metalloregulator ArsR/SmtB family transcription factor [Nodularia spumigena CH309]